MTRLITLIGLISLSLNINAQTVLRKDLSENWQFSQSGLNEWLPATVPGTIQTDLLDNDIIQDPYYRMVEHDVQWIDKVGWDYKTVFDADPAWMKAGHAELVFDGLDTYATVYLNGTEIQSADNMFLSYRVDVKKLLKPKGNELLVRFASPIFEGLKKQAAFGLRLPAINDQSVNGQIGKNQVSIFTRKAGYHYGWDWGPRLVPSGIWRPVRMEAWNSLRISDVYIATETLQGHSAKMLADVTWTADQPGQGQLLIQTGEDKWVIMSTSWKAGENHVAREFVVMNPKLWWPKGYGDQPLYSLFCRITGDDGTKAEVNFKTGIRLVRLVQDPDPDGNGRSFFFEVNKVPVFAKGANYIPSDMFVPRLNGEDYRKVVGSAAFANMNMLRVWGGGIYENDIFYDLCDENGILVWQDFMFACSMYPGTDDFLNSVSEEARQNIVRLRKHPCMALWCGNNEIEAAWGPYEDKAGWGWKQRYTPEQQQMIWQAYDTLFHHILPQQVKELTPTIPYWHSSPSAGMGKLATNETRSGDNHYWGVWHQKHPFGDYNKYISRFMSEYGFQSFPEYDAVKKYTLPEDENIESPVMSSHQRSGIGNLRIREYMKQDYRIPAKFEDFLYVSQLLQAEGIKTAMLAHRKNKPYCMGTLYWQLNDCWPVASWSSTDYYRNYKAVHYAAKKAYEPVIIIPTTKDGKVEFRINSDELTPHAGNLDIRTLTFDGKVLFEQKLPVTIDPQSNKVAVTIPVGTLMAGKAVTGLVVVATLDIGSPYVTPEYLYLVEPKDLKLSKPAIKLAVKDGGSGWLVSVSSDVLAKNAMITFNGRAGIFSDNYFDILPGETVTISLSKEYSANNPEKALAVKTLTDTY
jgi:beta-mannosidase